MARFFAFFTLFHLSLTFLRPEVPFNLTLSCLRGGGYLAPPLRSFAHNSEREKDNSTKFGDFS